METKQSNPILFNPQEMLSPFDTIKETDGLGHEWRSSRKLTRGLEYVPENAKMGSFHFQYVPQKSILGTC